MTKEERLIYQIYLLEYAINSSQVPRLLYKYYPWPNEHSESAICNGYLYHSTKKEVSDVGEYSYIAKTGNNSDFEEYLEQAGKLWGFSKEYLSEAIRKNSSIFDPKSFEEFNKTAIEKQTKEFGMFCMTEDPFNPMMWDNYASKSSGIVIQFDLTEDLNAFNFPIKMQYSDETPEVNPYKIGESKMNHSFFKTKKTVYSGEKEFRVFKAFRNGKVPFRKQSAKEVILGHAWNETNILEIMKNLIHWGYGCPVFKIEIKGTERKYEKELLRDRLF